MMLARRLQSMGLQCSAQHGRGRALFSSTDRANEKPFPPRIKVDENSITETFLKGTGPGGQKINKTSSAVQLKHLPTGIVVKCQDTRSREQNRRTARRLLGERLEEKEKGSESRTAVKAERARGKKASAEKKKRRKYRRLEEEKAAAAGGKEGEGSEVDGTEGVGLKNRGVQHGTETGTDGPLSSAGNETRSPEGREA